MNDRAYWEASSLGGAADFPINGRDGEYPNLSAIAAADSPFAMWACISILPSIANSERLLSFLAISLHLSECRAGREIAKGAYNNRNSEFGWNVDHVLPQSRGGKTTDYNLVFCHILTNDEKADRFPVFNANGRKFEILKVENQYEIKPVGKQKKEQGKSENKTNFYDSAYGVRLYKTLKGIQNKPRFVGSVLIRFNNVYNTALIDFIERLFDEENLSYSSDRGNGTFGYLRYPDWEETRAIIRNYDMPTKEGIQRLLDKCVLLNTYLEYYFKGVDAFDEYGIRFRVDCFENKADMYKQSQSIDFEEISGDFEHSLYINDLVVINTDASDKVKANGGWALFNYVYTKLAKNLEKEASK